LAICWHVVDGQYLSILTNPGYPAFNAAAQRLLYFIDRRLNSLLNIHAIWLDSNGLLAAAPLQGGTKSENSISPIFHPASQRRIEG